VTPTYPGLIAAEVINFQMSSMPSRKIRIPTLAVIAASFLTLSIFTTSSLFLTPIFAQNITQSEGNNGGEDILHITKDATNSYIISSGVSFIGAFDTTYSIAGSVRSIEASKDLIISTITEDFGSSPTIGYVDNTGSPPQANLTQPGLPNPFATKADIDEKIKNEVTASVETAAASNSVNGEIKCLFGSSLNDFKCNFHQLTG
jgi:hypothetical protein